jgi:hypothetical protein
MTSNEFMNFYFVYLLYNKQPMDEKKPELTAEDILEAKIIARLRKQVKHVPSEKQQKHIDKLAQAKKGTKYVKKVEPKVPTQDTQEFEAKEVVKRVKKERSAKKKVEPKVEPEHGSEASSDSSEVPVPKKRVEKIPKKVVRSKPVANQAIPKVVEPEPPRSLFRKSLL